jgi:hypothetical protein
MSAAPCHDQFDSDRRESRSLLFVARKPAAP